MPLKGVFLPSHGIYINFLNSQIRIVAASLNGLKFYKKLLSSFPGEFTRGFESIKKGFENNLS